MEAKNSQDLQSANRRNRRAYGVAPVKKPAGSRPKKSQGFCPNLKIGKDLEPALQSLFV